MSFSTVEAITVITVSCAVVLLFFTSSLPVVHCYSANPLSAKSLPTYCSDVSTPAERDKFIENRKIPVLQTQIQNAELIQVQVLIRHGARTMYEAMPCWSGFRSKFDCQANGEAVRNFNPAYKQLTFSVKYDARVDLETPNSCSYGQLIGDGYQQQQLNGEILAKAYFTGENPLVQFDKELNKPEGVARALYFRTTALERTRMSGAQLVSSLIRTALPTLTKDPHITMHSVEYNKETLFLNFELCPDLTEIYNRAFMSEEYRERFGQCHAKARELADRMFNLEKEQPNHWPVNVFECLHIGMCGRQDLPSGFTEDDAHLILSATDEEWQYGWRFNNSEFSKKAHSRLLVEMKAFIIKMLPELQNSPHAAGYDEIYEKAPGIQQIPFVLWSGHDTTVGPFLATFGEQMWNATDDSGDSFPPYAAMGALEVYSSSLAGPMVRLVYNSKVLTKYILGCPSDDDLCPIETFFETTAWATPDEALRGCKRTDPVPFTFKFTVGLGTTESS